MAAALRPLKLRKALVVVYSFSFDFPIPSPAVSAPVQAIIFLARGYNKTSHWCLEGPPKSDDVKTRSPFALAWRQEASREFSELEVVAGQATGSDRSPSHDRASSRMSEIAPFKDCVGAEKEGARNWKCFSCSLVCATQRWPMPWPAPEAGAGPFTVWPRRP